MAIAEPLNDLGERGMKIHGTSLISRDVGKDSGPDHPPISTAAVARACSALQTPNCVTNTLPHFPARCVGAPHEISTPGDRPFRAPLLGPSPAFASNSI
jgi:hypothetical protein